MTLPLIVLGIPLTLLVGYLIGHMGANAAIRHERELVETLTAERDGLQTRYMALLDKEEAPCQSK